MTDEHPQFIDSIQVLPLATPVGTCCACQERIPDQTSRSAIYFNFKSPTPGRGWGCKFCDLPSEGAVSVICQPCIEAGKMITHVVEGDKGLGRVMITELETVPHLHGPHPQLSGPPHQVGERFSKS